MAVPTGTTFREMMEAATRRSMEADGNWSREPTTKVPGGGRSAAKSYLSDAIHKYQSYDPKTRMYLDDSGKYIPTDKEDYPEEKPKPADWGSW